VFFQVDLYVYIWGVFSDLQTVLMASIVPYSSSIFPRHFLGSTAIGGHTFSVLLPQTVSTILHMLSGFPRPTTLFSLTTVIDGCIPFSIFIMFSRFPLVDHRRQPTGTYPSNCPVFRAITISPCFSASFWLLLTVLTRLDLTWIKHFVLIKELNLLN